MDIIIGIILLLVIVAVVVALIAYSASRRRITIDFSKNPEIICRSNSCVVNASWEIQSQGGELDEVRIQIVKPSHDVILLSNDASGSLTLNSTDTTIFDQTGVYFIEVHARSSDVVRTESHRIAFHSESEFFLNDSWNTGFVGGNLSADETVATRSMILSQEPFIGQVTEIDSKLPGSVTVCSKSMALRKVIYQTGTIRSDGTSVRKIEVTIRRPGGQEIINQTLSLGDELALPQEELVNGGIEILSIMRSEVQPPRSIGGSSWTLRFVLGCVS